ncbi:MAG: response regulator [Desulfobacterales bacterium]|jgi:CheY-like chemotaxis protein/cytidylate kinase|nr:response regulator [Desulfobacterales bacterium]
MSNITIFNGIFCNEAAVIEQLALATNYKIYTDQDLVTRAKGIAGLSEAKLFRAFSTQASIFNNFTHEKERAIAGLKLAMAELISEDNLLLHGFCAQLIPRTVSHVLRICLIADVAYREAQGLASRQSSSQEVLKLIHRQDEECAAWVRTLYEQDDPWKADLYDIVIPMNRTSIAAAVKLITDNLAKEVLKTDAQSRKAVADFLLAARTEVALGKEGHSVEVTAESGVVTLTINKHVLLLSRLEEELKEIAGKVDGVTSVVTKVGKGYHQADIYRKFDFEAPSRVLLVDDEREFVQTLSERLIMRDVSSAVAYDGESALCMIDEDEPDVMILDLKMPGIDGIEVLKRVKSTRPGLEVIILTGHGSEVDRETCMKLGAFAYLQKPVDIDLLSKTLKEANEKIRKCR